VGVALGMIEVFGIPTAIEVADAMCKGASVTLVGYENTDFGRITVLIRGSISEVQAAVAAGLIAIDCVNGGELLSHHIIARPHENLEYALSIGHSEEVEQFVAQQFPDRGSRAIAFPPPLSP
jgi:carbon dioxide concentrating mechanism protein CcmK